MPPLSTAAGLNLRRGGGSTGLNRPPFVRVLTARPFQKSAARCRIGIRDRELDCGPWRAGLLPVARCLRTPSRLGSFKLVVTPARLGPGRVRRDRFDWRLGQGGRQDVTAPPSGRLVPCACQCILVWTCQGIWKVESDLL